jgi:hypothetical protein
VNFAPESIASKSKAWMVGGASPAGKFNWRSISQVPIDLFSLPVGQLNTNSESKYGGLILETGDAPGIFKGCGILTINDNTTSLFDVSGTYIRGHRNCCQIPSHSMAECARYPLSKSSASHARSLPTQDDAWLGLRGTLLKGIQIAYSFYS